MTATAYPLSWPPTFHRSKSAEKGRFKATLDASIKNVQDSLRMFASDSGKKLDGLVISSNVTLGAHRPADPGVAVWFVWDGLQVCIAVDRYNTVEGNLQAIHHIIEARRVELRHGTLALVRATFQGFRALPAPATAKTWRDILDVPDHGSMDDQLARAKMHYRACATVNHPDRADRGGSAEKMVEINKAWEQAQKELGNG